MACGALFATAPARASNINWSIGISAPIYPAEVSTVISNGPYYAPPPVYVRPAPVYYDAWPVYVRPAPVYYYARPPVYVRPAPVVVRPWAPYHDGHWRHPRYHDRWQERSDHWNDRREPRDHDGWRR
jgi:hypothetical protein